MSLLPRARTQTKRACLQTRIVYADKLARRLTAADCARAAAPISGVHAAMTSSTATFVGFTAILMWSLLSLLTVASGTVPPFQLAAMTFALGGALGAATWLFRPGAANAL